MPFWNKQKKLKRKEKHIEKSIQSKKIVNILPPYLKKAKRAVLSASMTVEATFIIPLFVFYSIIMIYVMNLINFQNRVNEGMYDTARTLSKLEYNALGSANDISAMALLHAQLKEEAVDNMGIRGGRLGITSFQSEFEGENINFTVNYTICIPFDFLGIADLNCMQRFCVRKWIGNEDKGNDSDYKQNREERMVYITETGTVYHLDRNCTYLMLSRKSISLDELKEQRNLDGGKYHACELCSGNGSNKNIVYITDWGDRYHADVNCSGLKRSVMTVPYTSVADWSECSRCGGL